MNVPRRPSSRPRRWSGWSRVPGLVALALLVTACTTAGGRGDDGAAARQPPSTVTAAQASPDPSVPSSAHDLPVGISAVGDVIMGSAPQLPPHDGRQLFDGVAGHVTEDVALANLDQALTDDATV